MNEMPADLAWVLAGVTLTDAERALIAAADLTVLTSLLTKVSEAATDRADDSARHAEELR